MRQILLELKFPMQILYYLKLVSTLEQNVDKILLTQSKILRNQDMIFDQLWDLEHKYRVLSEEAVSSHHSVSAIANYNTYPKSVFSKSTLTWVVQGEQWWWPSTASSIIPPYSTAATNYASDATGHCATIARTLQSHLPLRQPVHAPPQPPSTF